MKARKRMKKMATTQKFEIYRTLIYMGKTYESLVCVTFTEEDARNIVEAMRKQVGNQSWHYTKAQ